MRTKANASCARSYYNALDSGRYTRGVITAHTACPNVVSMKEDNRDERKQGPPRCRVASPSRSWRRVPGALLVPGAARKPHIRATGHDSSSSAWCQASWHAQSVWRSTSHGWTILYMRLTHVQTRVPAFAKRKRHLWASQCLRRRRRARKKLCRIHTNASFPWTIPTHYYTSALPHAEQPPRPQLAEHSVPRRDV